MLVLGVHVLIYCQSRTHQKTQRAVTQVFITLATQSYYSLTVSLGSC